MYVVGPGIKQDPFRRWSLPDRVFFACGACHILAYAFLKTYPDAGFAPLWIKPAKGFTGNHIVVVRNDMAFDYHGFSCWNRLLAHTTRESQSLVAGLVSRIDPAPDGRADLGSKVA